MKVLILGSGPAGLFAAHAAVQAGAAVAILSAATEPSYIVGAEFMRQPVPGLTEEPVAVTIKLEGEWDEYEKKVEGDVADLRLSSESLFDDIVAWDLRAAYEKAWNIYSNLIVHEQIQGTVPLFWQQWADVIISSIPAHSLCLEASHQFVYRTIYTSEFVKKADSFESDEVDNLVVCSGYEDDWWYRQSRVFGHETTEYPADRHPNKSVTRRSIPMLTNCDCHPNIIRVGRNGSWSSGVFADAAFYDTQRAIRVAELGVSA